MNEDVIKNTEVDLESEESTIKRETLLHSAIDLYYPVLNKTMECEERSHTIIKELRKFYPTEPLIFICTGSSGLYLSTLLKVLDMNSEILYECKEGESSHGRSTVGCKSIGTKTLILVDDFISSGDTYIKVLEALIRNFPEDKKRFDCLVTFAGNSIIHLEYLEHRLMNNSKLRDSFIYTETYKENIKEMLPDALIAYEN